MKTRGVIGRRIVAVRQRRLEGSGGGVAMDILEIELEGGVLLRPLVRETEAEVPEAIGGGRVRVPGDYAVDLLIIKKRDSED